MLRLGRKIFVIGIVISFAPLVLPPLTAIFAIGFVCSIFYGIFLVSHGYTETVMSRLLPTPSPAAPLLLEYRKALSGKEEANGDEDQGEQNKVIKGGISMEREKEELKEDIIEEVEMRIELVDKEQEKPVKGKILQEGAYQKGGVKSEQSADEGHGLEAVVKEDEKHKSSIEKQTTLEAKYVKSKKELASETGQSVRM